MLWNLIFCCQKLIWRSLYRLFLDILDVLSISRNLEKIMIWLCAQYIFLKYETNFKILGKNVLIRHPVVVSMSEYQLAIRQNVTKPWFCPNFAILRGLQGCPKKTCEDFAKSISGNAISNFKTFGTTGFTIYWNLFQKEKAIQVKTCIT